MFQRFLALICIGLMGSQIATARRPSYGIVNLVDQSHFNLQAGKMVIDVDVGADDSTAIMLTLAHDVGRSGGDKHDADVQVVAITCVQGNADINNVVANTLVTLHASKRMDIPVYKGATDAIYITPPHDFFFGKNGFGDFVYPNAPEPAKFVQKKHAVNALIDIVSQSPGEVTVLCLGPLTNIALAIRLDPLFLTKVRRLVVLGGSVEGLGNVRPGVEFNFYKDPAAAFIVLNATDTSNPKIPPIVLVPWETVVKRGTLPLKWRKNVLGTIDSPYVRLMNLAEGVGLRTWTEWTSADPLAALVAVNSAVVQTWVRHYAYVETQGDSAGAVFVDYTNKLRRSPNVLIVQQLDMDMYKEIMLKKFTA